MRGALILMALAAPAGADPLGLVDYDAIIDARGAEAVEVWGGNRMIRLPGEVEIIFNPAGEVVAARDTGTALGCIATLLIEFGAMARTCPGAVGPGDADGLDTLIGALIPAYAAGVLPEPVPPETVAALFEVAIQDRRAAPTFECAIPPDIAFALSSMTSPDGVALLLDDMSRPRLPVSDPCF